MECPIYLFIFFCWQKKMKLLPEVWAIIFSFLPCNYLMEISAVCKLFHCFSWKNAGFVEKLSHFWLLFSGFNLHEHFRDACLSLAGQFSNLMNEDFKDDVFFKAKEIIMDRLIFSILPIRLWNHMFFSAKATIALTFVCIVRELTSVIERFLII